MTAISLAPSPWLLAIAVLVAGMSSGLTSPPLAEAVAARISSERQGRANTFINSGSSFGVAFSGPIAFAYAGAWREAYLVFAVLAAGVTVWAWLALPARGHPGGGAAAREFSIRAIQRPAARPLILAAFGMGAASAAYWTFAGEIMSAVGELPPPIVSTAWVVVGIAGFAGAAAGDLAQRFGIGGVNRAGLFALATATLAVGLLPGQVVVAYAAAALFGASYIMLSGLYIVWGVQVFSDRPAIGIGLPFLMIALGQAVGAAAAGGLSGMVGYATAFTVFTGIALVTMLATPQIAANAGQGTA